MPDPIRSRAESFQFYGISTCDTLKFWVFRGGELLAPFVAAGIPTGSVSYIRSLRVKLYITESGEAFFENAHFTIEFTFI